jgi:hypothetical protein
MMSGTRHVDVNSLLSTRFRVDTLDRWMDFVAITFHANISERPRPKYFALPSGLR